jgi:hypothetical protein
MRAGFTHHIAIDISYFLFPMLLYFLMLFYYNRFVLLFNNIFSQQSCYICPKLCRIIWHISPFISIPNKKPTRKGRLFKFHPPLRQPLYPIPWDRWLCVAQFLGFYLFGGIYNKLYVNYFNLSLNKNKGYQQRNAMCNHQSIAFSQR